MYNIKPMCFFPVIHQHSCYSLWHNSFLSLAFVHIRFSLADTDQCQDGETNRGIDSKNGFYRKPAGTGGGGLSKQMTCFIHFPFSRTHCTFPVINTNVLKLSLVLIINVYHKWRQLLQSSIFHEVVL